MGDELAAPILTEDEFNRLTKHAYKNPIFLGTREDGKKLYLIYDLSHVRLRGRYLAGLSEVQPTDQTQERNEKNQAGRCPRVERPGGLVVFSPPQTGVK